MPKIECLSPHVADLIAAGEVVERPASAAKELVENAIDAGAKHVTVELQNGGMTFLRVTDDGCGMEAQDAETAFLRHATSKLRRAEDLEAIRTLGFRGEALAAISSVSRIDLLTRTADSDFGASLHLEAGVVTERGEAGCPVGTTIIVRDLFYNTPARLKFMKRDSVEASALLSTVQRLALAHPEVSVRLLRDGAEQLNTPGDGALLSAIHATLGRQTAKEMVAVQSRWDKYSLTGYVSLPNATRGTRSNQLFFVNGRNIRSKTMTAALEEAYRNRLMVGRFPSCVLCLQVPEHLVDVNVHPAKTEVKFLNERELFDCVRYGVQGALDNASGRVTMRLPQERAAAPRAESAAVLHDSVAAPRATTSGGAKSGGFYHLSAEEFRAYAQTLRDAPRAAPRPAQTPPEAASPAPPSKSAPDFSSVGRGLAPAMPPIPAAASEPIPDSAPAAASKSEHTSDFDPAATPEIDSTPAAAADVAPTAEPEQTALPMETAAFRVVGEVLNTYIVVEQEDTVLLIDKHAAHERVLFEKLRASQEPIMPQLLLSPLLFEPEREECAVLLENEALLRELGYELSDYGDGVLAVRQIPSELAPEQAAGTLSALAADLMTGKRLDPTALRDRLLHTIACKAAIKGGWHTDTREREALVREVLSREDLKYCPHGRPICIILTAAQLERQFKRA